MILPNAAKTLHELVANRIRGNSSKRPSSMPTSEILKDALENNASAKYDDSSKDKNNEDNGS